MGVHRETDVDQGDESCHDVPDMGCLRLVSFRNVQAWGWHHLLPSKARVNREDDNSDYVEQAPPEILEQFEFQSVDVTNVDSIAPWRVDPEQIESQLEQCTKVDQVRGRAQREWFCRSKPELEKVDYHEGQKSNSRDRQIQLSNATV